MIHWKTSFDSILFDDDVIFVAASDGEIRQGIVAIDDECDHGYPYCIFTDDRGEEYFYEQDVLCWCSLRDLKSTLPQEIIDKMKQSKEK